MEAIIKKECAIPVGFTGTALKGHTVINVVNQLPPEYDYLREKIEAENGQGYSNTGDARICTNLDGKTLKGFREVTGGHGKYSYGYCFVSKSYVEIRVNRHGNEISATIKKITPTFPENEVRDWWDYDGDEGCAILPNPLAKFQNALDAAIEKSHCYHCHCLHFYGGDDTSL